MMLSINPIFSFFLCRRRCGLVDMILGSDKHNAALFLLVAAVLSVMMSNCTGTNVTVRTSRDLQVSNQQKSLEGESTSEKLIHMRQLLKSIILDWNFGESDLKGKTDSRGNLNQIKL
jgi:hypothetical protein